MDALSQSLSEDPNLAGQAEALARPASLAHRMADAIRALAIDAADHAEARSSRVDPSAEQDPPSPARFGNLELPMAMADAATALWTRFLKFDAADPRWPDRDRFILSAGHGSLLLYGLIHLTGHDGLSLDDLRDFSRLHSPAAARPEYGGHSAIEASTGPPGQGFATAVGMALAERNMAARFGKSLVDHRTWVIASDADMMHGISHEAAALAGQFGLSKLAVLYDQSQSAAAGDKPMSASDVPKRFSACGWATKRVDGHDPAQINAALSFAVRSKKPTLIACRTVAGVPPVVEPDVEPHASTDRPVAAVKALRDWHEPPFVTPDDLKERWQAVGSRGAASRRSWLKRLARHHQRDEFERVMVGRLPDNWHEATVELKQQIADDRPRMSTRKASQSCLDMLVTATPELIAGSAGLTPATAMPAVSAGNYGGRHIQFGVRHHGMAATANGMALHGGIIPCIAAAFVCTDDLRPALRLSALMRQRVIYCLTDDSIGLGQGGPTHQPVEHLAGLRATPDLHVFRPCDAIETAECWELAVRRTDGPSLLALSAQALLAWRTDTTENRCARGGYVLAEAEGARQATIIATGSEVSIAMAAREKLAGDNIAAAVVSLPCWELFALQDEAYRAQVLGGAPRVGVEAAAALGWDRWIGPEGTFIGMTGFGASADHGDLYRHFGITPEAVVAAVVRLLG